MREMVEIFPAKLRKLWNDLELRVLVLLSLFLQIVLISTGNRRKYTTKKRVTVILWLSYLSADAVATISLGVLSQAQSDAGSLHDPSYTIMALWAPFLLMHLGGPDTITAYALADNELWSRHLLGLVSQVGVAIYIFLRSWTGTPINYLWIVVLVAALVKYGERIWVLFLASRDQLPEWIVSPSDPERPKFMDKVYGKAIDIVSSSSVQDAVVLQDAYSLFGIFKKLFADFILSGRDWENSLTFFMHTDMTWDKAFSIVEVELGLIYDLIYTKAFILYSPHGFFLRMLSFSSTTAASIAFLIIDTNIYPKTEVIITYILLGGAIFLEIYAIMILLSSDRTMIWLSGDWTTLPRLMRKFKNTIVSTICKTVSLLRYLHIVPARRRWSNAMGQYNVLNSCLGSKPKCSKVHEYLEKYLFLNSVIVPECLKALVFDELKERARTGYVGKRFGSCRGDNILLRQLNYFHRHDEQAEFDESVLLWHLATDFCYHIDVGVIAEITPTWLYEFIINEESTLENNLRFKREICRLLSNYMMHLLIKSPFILPNGIGKTQFRDTCAEATELFVERKSIKLCACDILCRMDTPVRPYRNKASRSLLFDACRLFKSLQSQEDGQKWETITQAWLYILTFAASQCRWNDHAEKLSQGGELLTHVWLLMAHFGIMSAAFEI